MAAASEDQTAPDPQTAGSEIGVVSLRGCRCRCGHEWLPRKKSERPAVCPKCKSPRWDRPRKRGA